MPLHDYSWAGDILRALASEHDETGSIVHTQLALCVSVTANPLQALREACLALIHHCDGSKHENTLDAVVASLSTLLHDAYEGMRSTNQSCWRYLYTEASILRSLASLFIGSRAESVAQLDRAIIIAGPAGVGRHDFVLSLIAKIQDQDQSAFQLRADADVQTVRLPDNNIVCSDSLPLPSALNEVPIYDPPSLMAFRTKASSTPFILRGYAKGWPALNEHPWGSLSYLRRVAGPSRLVPVEVGLDYRDEGWSQDIMPWDDFLDTLKHSSDDLGSRGTIYMAQHSLFRQFPSLENDIEIPDYVYADLDAPENFPSYIPPGNDQQLVISSWLGPKGTITPAHTDPFFNLYTQVVGTKTVWLAPPQCSAHMASILQSALANTSSIDVFSQKPPIYSEFWECVPEKAMSATLFPGDMLYFPPGWWHAMRAEDVSHSVSMWF